MERRMHDKKKAPPPGTMLTAPMICEWGVRIAEKLVEAAGVKKATEKTDEIAATATEIVRRVVTRTYEEVNRQRHEAAQEAQARAEAAAKAKGGRLVNPATGRPFEEERMGIVTPDKEKH
jgi:type IV secretory pathway TrbL component